MKTRLAALIDLNAFYDKKLSEDENLKLGAVVSMAPNNDSSNSTEATLMAKYSLKF